VPGEPSEPAHVAGTADYAADRWQVSVDEAWDRLARNFEALFGEPP
jgi:Tat protein secretion system quality control protein TatD with DNase activity